MEREDKGTNGPARNATHGNRLARTHYTVRTVSFAYCFIVIGLVLWERHAGALAWSLLALQFLVYPQLAYLHAVSAADSQKAETGNLYFDSLTLGAHRIDQFGDARVNYVGFVQSVEHRDDLHGSPFSSSRLVAALTKSVDFSLESSHLCSVIIHQNREKWKAAQSLYIGHFVHK